MGEHRHISEKTHTINSMMDSSSMTCSVGLVPCCTKTEISMRGSLQRTRLTAMVLFGRRVVGNIRAISCLDRCQVKEL